MCRGTNCFLSGIYLTAGLPNPVPGDLPQCLIRVGAELCRKVDLQEQGWALLSYSEY